MDMNKKAARTRVLNLIETTSLVSGADLKKESVLLLSKWPDYSFLSPWEATIHFGKIYQNEFRRNIATHVDIELSKNSKGIDLSKLSSSPGLLTSLWRARQKADKLGMKYESYISLCFEFAMNRKRKNLPQPNQLHYSQKSEYAWRNFVLPKWDEYLVEGIIRPEGLPQYRLEYYRQLPAQERYRQLVIQRCCRDTRPLKSHINRYSIELNHLPMESFKDCRSAAAYEAAIQSIDVDQKLGLTIPQPCPTISQDQLWQSCFGIHAARNKAAEPCRECPQQSNCERVAEHILLKVRKQTGSDDPILAKRREQTRNRVKRLRDRRKVGKSLLRGRPSSSSAR